MQNYNRDKLIGFYGYRKTNSDNTADPSNRYYYFSLQHFLECEKFRHVDKGYYDFLSELTSDHLLLLETKGVSYPYMDEEYIDDIQSIMLVGVHFLILQNLEYFYDFLNHDQQLACDEEKLLEVFIYYRKRFYASSNLNAVSFIGDKLIDQSNDMIESSVLEKFSDHPPEVMIVANDQGISVGIEGMSWRHRIPITIVDADVDPEDVKYSETLQKLADESSVGVILSTNPTEGDEKIFNHFLGLMGKLQRKVHIIQK